MIANGSTHQRLYVSPSLLQSLHVCPKQTSQDYATLIISMHLFHIGMTEIPLNLSQMCWSEEQKAKYLRLQDCPHPRPFIFPLPHTESRQGYSMESEGIP